MPNRVLPEFWCHNTTIRSLRGPTQLFLFWLALNVDDYWRLAVGTSLERPDFLRSRLYPVGTDVRLPDIARFLNETKEAGVVRVANSDRGWYVEIEEAFRYRRNEQAEKQPKYGPYLRATPAQGDLMLGPVPLSTAPAPRIPTQAIRVVVGGEDERIAEAGAVAPKAKTAAGESEESKRTRGFYAAGRWDRQEDEVWVDVCEFLTEGQLSCPELWNNGKRWLSRLDHERRALAEAVGEARLLEKEKYEFKNRGAWLGDQFERCRGGDQRSA